MSVPPVLVIMCMPIYVCVQSVTLTSLHTLPAVFSQAAEVKLPSFLELVLINQIVHDQTAVLHSYLYKRNRNFKTLG